MWILFAALAFEVFLCLIIPELRERWDRTGCLTVLITGSVLNVVLMATEIACYFKGRELIGKLCIVIYFLLIFSALIMYLLLKTGFWEIAGSKEALEEYLKQTGAWMKLLFILLQFLQVVVLPIPSTITVVAGSVLFGPFLGSLYSLTGIVLGSLTAFLIGRYAGYRVVAWLVGKEPLDKWLKKIKGKDKLFLTAMFLLPVFPDDILCFVAGLSSMSVWFFLVIITISRILAIFATSYSVRLIPFNTWWGLLIWALLLAAVVLLFVFLYKKSDVILQWIDKKFHRGMRIEKKTQKNEFTVEIVDPDGSVVRKGVEKGDSSKQNGASR